MNPVIGNEALNKCPLATIEGHSMTEIDKIRCHLSFALEKLRDEKISKGVNHPKCTRRNDILSTLKEYIEEGNFPKHDDIDVFLHNSTARKPYFVDSEGTPCAVAYLMQKSGGKMLVNDILDASHKYDTIAEIAQNDALKPALESWSSSVGIAISDLALIQPTYVCRIKEEERKRKIRNIQDFYNIEPERRGKDCTLSQPFLDKDGKPTAKIPNKFLGLFNKHLMNDETEKELNDILKKWDGKRTDNGSRFYFSFSASTAEKSSRAANELREKEYIKSIDHDSISVME